ncbi:MAG: acyl-CoA dehydrogenase family protein [Chrysiogenetes bacterium]|nr:acyl-CoA dehydrogenase family protein [Chrysiogenetes bacterium]
MSVKSRKDSPEQAEFRAYCAKWLEENRPPKPDFRMPQSALEVMDDAQRVYLQNWQKQCYDAGLVGCDYPAEYGGGGKKDLQRIANEEMKRAKTPFLIQAIGLGMVAPTILTHGTEEQKKRYIPKVLSGEEIWCQGFSEPGAGSDLANVQSVAEKKGDKWIINGHKVWTTLGHVAQFMILLARHDKSDKYKGLTYFLIPIEGHPGVSVRPLIKMTGETGFNEVLFEDAEIPDSMRLDEVGKGWDVAMTTLLHERGAGGLVPPGAGGAGMGSETVGRSAWELVGLAKECKRGGRPASEDPILRDKIVESIINETAIRQNARRMRVPALNDHPMRLNMQLKLLTTEHPQRVGEIGLEIQGQRSTLYIGDENAPADGRWPLAYMNTYGSTIAGGTSEVQRNILGERVLGMPKSK